MSRPLVSPVIIRPKHGAFKGVPLVAVENMNCEDCCLDDESCGIVDGEDDLRCMGRDYHHEHAEVRDE